MLVKINKCRLFGTAEFPPSKSDSHRLLIAAALADGKSRISNISLCDDVLATIASLSALGASITVSGNVATVRGIDIFKARASDELAVNESGSTLRFLIPLALLTDKEIKFSGAKRLFERPLSVYEKIAGDMGARFDLSSTSLTVKGKIHGGDYHVPGNISSQFITGLLFALPLCSEDSTIIIEPPFESKPYVDMTIATLKHFGVFAKFEDENTININGGQNYTFADARVEGDWSGGAFLFALKQMHPDILISGYSGNSLQGDRICIDCFEKIKNGNPTIDISDCPDLGPVLFAMAAYFGGAEFIGTRRLLIKESDRATAMRDELKKFGATVEIYENSVKVSGGALHAPTSPLFGHGDHRIVMALSVLATVFGGEIIGAEAINKSYPEFFEVLKSLGGSLVFGENYDV